MNRSKIMRVFISHAEQDRKLAAKLAAALTTRGFEVWEAAREILPGTPWSQAISEALTSSDAMVVLYSAAYEQSGNARSELEFALGNERYRNRVIPVVLGSPPSTPWLRLLHFLRFEGDAEELARQVGNALRDPKPVAERVGWTTAR